MKSGPFLLLFSLVAMLPCWGAEPAASGDRVGQNRQAHQLSNEGSNTEATVALSVARRFVDAVVAKDVNLAKGLVDPQWVPQQYLALVVTMVEELTLKPRAEKPFVLSPITANTVRIRVFWQSAPECFVDFEMELTQSAPGTWRVKNPICEDSFGPRTIILESFPVSSGDLKPRASIPQTP